MTNATADPERLLSELDSLPPGHRAHHVDGAFYEPDTAAFDTVINPATGEPLASLPSGDIDVVDAAVVAAGRALRTWRRTTPMERSARLLELADRLDQNAEHLARLEALQVGKPLGVARPEVPLAADALRFFAGATRSTQAPAPAEYLAGQFSLVRREPVGVVGAIAPWNYPLLMGVWKIAPALAAGNTVVLKPSELTPLTTLRLAELAAEVLPAGVLNIILGTGPVVGQAIAAHPDVAMVSLTGSVESGKAVSGAATDNLKRVHLELGGKAPVIVFPDADLDAAAEAIVTAGFWNSGQECGSAARVLVHRSVYDDLMARIVPATEALQVGDPEEGEQIEIGPLISSKHRARVTGFVDRAVDDGADLVCGGSSPDRRGWYYTPTILGHVREGTEIEQHEVFGPVVGVQTFEDEADAVRLANSTRYGLAASVWTHDAGRSLRVPAELDFGTVWVNSHLTLCSELPWNGFGQSGHGRDMSVYALDDHTRTKHIMMAMHSAQTT